MFTLQKVHLAANFLIIQPKRHHAGKQSVALFRLKLQIFRRCIGHLIQTL